MAETQTKDQMTDMHQSAEDLPAILDFEDGEVSDQEVTYDRCCTALNSLFAEYSSSRNSRERIWRICMILYYSSSDAYSKLAEEAPTLVGKVKTDWRHKLHGPFAYENVETVVGYLQGARFPNAEYFTLDPTKAEDTFRAMVATALVHHKLNEAQVKKHWEDFDRMQAIIGFAVMSMSWEKVEGKQKYREESVEHKMNALGEHMTETTFVPAERDYCLYDNLRLKVEDPTHIYLDPTASDPNEGGIFRVIPMKLKEILGKMQSGYFMEHDTLLIRRAQTQLYSQRGDISDSLFKDIQGYGSFNKPVQADPEYEVMEYFGDLMVNDKLFVDYHFVFLGDLMLVCEPNQFWAGKPFVGGNYTRVQGRPYGMGLLEPSLGYYVLADVLQNQRLDAFELALNGGIIKVRQQCPMDPEDITVEPGKYFEVVEADDVSLLELPLDNVRIGREEIAAIVEQIQKSGGTSSYVNAGVARQGERVTSNEVETVKAAGGNRLNAVQRPSEENSFVPFLQKSFFMYAQHVDNKQTLRILGNSKIGRMQLEAEAQDDTEMIAFDGEDPSPPEYLYINAGPKELAGVYSITAKGSGYILDRAEKFNQFTSTAQLLLSNPATAAHVDGYKLATVILEHSGLDGWERFIKLNAGVDQQIEQQKKIQAAMQPPAPAQADPMAMAAQALGAAAQSPLLGGSSDPTVGTSPEGYMAGAQAGGIEPYIKQLSGGAQSPGQNPPGT